MQGELLLDPVERRHEVISFRLGLDPEQPLAGHETHEAAGAGRNAGGKHGYDLAVQVVREAEAVHDAGGHHDDGAGSKAQPFAAEKGISLSGSNLQDLKKRLVAVLLDFPIVQPAARLDGFGMNPEFRNA